MKMLARLRYLIEEGFDVSSISGYDDDSGNGNAKLMFVAIREDGARRIRSEIFDVSSEEMEKCSNFFLENLSKREEE